MKEGRWSFRALLLVFTIAASLGLSHYLQRGQPLITVWDVYGYYMYLPGVITYGDCTQWDFVDDHFADYPMQSEIYQRQQVGEQRVPIYTAGLSYLWLPGYVLADLTAQFTSFRRDGMSAPYQWSVMLTALLIAFLGLWCLRKLLLRYVDDKVVALVLVAMTLGTNGLQYGFLDPGMPHGYLFALHAAYFLAVDTWFHRSKGRYLLLAAGLLAIMCLIRPTEIVALLLPAVYMVIHRKRLDIHRSQFGYLTMAAVLMLVMVLPQLILWKMNTGHWVYNAYSEAGHVFHFDGRYLIDALLSYRKGWFVYTPMALAALIGLAISRGPVSSWKWPVAGLVALHAFTTFSWHMWWYANSFGARAMVHIYPELALGLAGGLAMAWKHKRWRITSLIVLGLLCALNVFQTWQYNQGLLPGDSITRKYYWTAFGKPDVPRAALRYLLFPGLKDKASYHRESLGRLRLDSPDDPDRAGIIRHVGRTAQELTPATRYSETLVLTLSQQQAEQLSGSWVDLMAEVFVESDDFDSSAYARLVFDCKRGEENVFWHAVNFQIFTQTGQWESLHCEYEIVEELRAGDVLKLYIWNQSPDNIYLEELGIDLLVKEQRRSH